ncbi:MAG TPA: phage tail protein [Blastococcus sp.]|jgi:phage tail-like protein
MTAPGARRDPYAGLRFRIQLEGLEVGGFSEVTGLEAVVETTTYREGGENSFEHKLAGPVAYPRNVTLRRGLTDSADFWDWLDHVGLGLVIRRNLTIMLLGADGEPALLWDCRAAFPVRWSGPELNAASPVVAFETLEVAHHGITRARGRSLIASTVRKLL